MKSFKDLSVFLLMFSMMFAMVYVLTLSADAEYEIQQERQNSYFDRVEEMRRWYQYTEQNQKNKILMLKVC